MGKKLIEIDNELWKLFRIKCVIKKETTVIALDRIVRAEVKNDQG